MSTEVVVALISTGLPLLAGGIAWLVRHLMGVTRILGEVKEQVANSHGTNLRDDLDLIRDLVMEVRADSAWVRRDHIDLEVRVSRLEHL